MTETADRITVELPVESKSFRAARNIAKILNKAGFEAWLVGGSVRDMVMGIEPHDWDIATSATPDRVLKLFDRTIPVGVQFGVVIVRMSGFDFEVATFRADCGYSDGRRPDEVRFTDLREDVLRRDFTMNGLALDAETGTVVDLVGGISDIREGLIRAIGDPDLRFEEDRLRQLRAVRFAAVTGFEIEPATLEAIRRNAAFISRVSVERISAEFQKMLLARDPARGFVLAAGTGLLAAAIPELPQGDAQRLTALVIDRLRGSGAGLMWAALLRELGHEGATATLRRLKRSNRDITEVSGIIENSQDATSLPLNDVAATKRLVRRPWFDEGVRLLEASLAATGESLEPVELARKLAAGYTQDELNPPQLVTGNDILAAGAARGPGIAGLLREIEDEQLRGSINTRPQAIEFIRKRTGGN